MNDANGRRTIWGCASSPAALILALAAVTAVAEPPRRQIALTFDDLPANSTRRDVATHAAITDKLLAGLARHRIPAIGFVNEGKLQTGADAAAEETDPARVALLERWLEAGLELGNHTYSHPSLYRTPLHEFQADVLRGEKVTRRLLGERGRVLTYFRHPFLNTGPDLATKAAFEAFLGEHGYRVAPVSIDNSEWIYARAYDHAVDRDDRAMARRVADAYVPYMDAVLAYYEQQSRALLSYELKQILLLHANRLNAETLDALIAMMKRRGYAFISLGEALTDEAYSLRDNYAGRAGITWLHRWALTEGKRGGFFKGEPEVPEFVMAGAGVDSQ